MLFDTQTDSFKNLVYSLENTFSDRSRNINEKEYNDFQQYILSSIYNHVAPVMYSSKVIAEQDGTLRWLASTFDPIDQVIRDGVYAGGRKLITFVNILEHQSFQLADILKNVLTVK